MGLALALLCTAPAGDQQSIQEAKLSDGSNAGTDAYGLLVPREGCECRIEL